MYLSQDEIMANVGDKAKLEDVKDFGKTAYSLGVELERNGDSTQAIGTCPICDREKKFYINRSTGQWDCKVCGESGNIYTLLTHIFKRGQKTTPEEKHGDLRINRKLLRSATLKDWGVVVSPLTGEWLVPAWSAENKLVQLYRYRPDDQGKFRLMPVGGLGHGLFGVPLFNPNLPDVYLCEGPWDAMALREIMKVSKRTEEGGLELTGTESVSLLNKSNVLAVPGCNVFLKSWPKLFAGKKVYILYDNDHPKSSAGDGKEVDPPGLAGMKRVAAALAQSEEPPLEIHYLSWGEAGFNLELPDGYDLRDLFGGAGNKGSERVPKLAHLLTRLFPVPSEWIPGRDPKAPAGGTDINCLPCAEWKVLIQSWKKAMKWTDGLEKALAVMLSCVTSTRASGDQLWCKIIGPPSCGKSTLCEALSVNRDFVYAKSTIRGFHSGYKTDKEGEEDNSLIPKIKNKTLVTKDGDTLLQAPNLKQILAEARDIYDTTARTHYRNKTDREYTNVRMTWLLCGTSSLHSIDSSELGERFLDCVIMDKIDPELEWEILWKVADRAHKNMAIEADDQDARSQHDPAMLKAMQLTGGYVNYLRNNAKTLLEGVGMSDGMKQRCMELGMFVSHFRAQPSTKQTKVAEREFSARLVIQMIRLATCLAVVLNRKEIDYEVIARVRDVALDTSRGPTLEIAKLLYSFGTNGLPSTVIMMRINDTDERVKQLLKFLKKIDVVEQFNLKTAKGVGSKDRYRLTPRMYDLYKRVMDPSEAVADNPQEYKAE